MTPKRDQRALGSYGGKSGQERQLQRRAQLLEAGLDRFGTDGYASSSVKSICASAGLTERYFYESFKDREDLLFAVYEMVAGGVVTNAFTATEAAEATVEARTRAGMAAFFNYLTGDVRRARVLAIEVVGVSERLEIRRRETIHVFAEYLATTGLEMLGEDSAPSLDPMLTALAMVGATNELLIEWLLGNLDEDVPALIDHCTKLIVSVTRVAFGEPFRDD